MDEANEILQRNRTEDVTWLCSLSESELDFLISLKKLISQRAKIIGHEELVEKFDLKMLRALGFVLMEHVRGRLKDNNISLAPIVADHLKLIESCSLLKTSVEDTMDIEEIRVLLGIDSRRKSRKR
ncbi:PREDICTED: uncharacterized protein LOC104808222 isoform X2 [Tarenaya hassleriana]|nr:PREDICTED: uncharacterized protein LOC104808222 isoform X2 [Tarenaya hassleriana]